MTRWLKIVFGQPDLSSCSGWALAVPPESLTDSVGNRLMAEIGYRTLYAFAA
jgi:hypothetical protein